MEEQATYGNEPHEKEIIDSAQETIQLTLSKDMVAIITKGLDDLKLSLLEKSIMLAEDIYNASSEENKSFFQSLYDMNKLQIKEYKIVRDLINSQILKQQK